jgi:hypothetical protein
MTATYIMYPATPSPSSQACSDTSDLLDAFLSPSNKNVRFAFPPDLASTSSSDGSSVEGDYGYGQQPQKSQPQDQSTALVPYYASTQPEQEQSRQMVLAKANISSSPSASSRNNNTTLTMKAPNKLIHVPRSSNPFGADAVHPKKKSMKKQRKQRTAAGAVGGMVVGGLTLGPAGVFFGAAAGAVATNKICKARERRAQRKYEQRNFQQAAERSTVHHATFA